MRKNKVHKVKLEQDLSFDLIGISSSDADYKVCWLINQELGISFIRTDDVVLFDKKKNEQRFAFYNSNIEDFSLFFLSNKGENGHIIEELRTMDYFIIINDVPKQFISEFKTKLKQIPSINGVFTIDVSTLKSKSRLSFEIPE